MRLCLQGWVQERPPVHVLPPLSTWREEVSPLCEEGLPEAARSGLMSPTDARLHAIPVKSRVEGYVEFRDARFGVDIPTCIVVHGKADIRVVQSRRSYPRWCDLCSRICRLSLLQPLSNLWTSGICRHRPRANE